MSEHCGECGSRLCNHGNCPGCRPCTHCGGGDREDKHYGNEEESSSAGYPPGYEDTERGINVPRNCPTNNRS
jgi:hypothetical protein